MCGVKLEHVLAVYDHQLPDRVQKMAAVLIRQHIHLPTWFEACGYASWHATCMLRLQEMRQQATRETVTSNEANARKRNEEEQAVRADICETTIR